MQWTVLSNEAGVRLDKFLAAADRAGSRARALSALDRGKVLVNGADAGATDAALRLAAGDVVRLWMDRPGSATRKPRIGRRGGLDVVYEDDELLVVNKPAGLLTVPLERKGPVPSVYSQIAEQLRAQGTSRPFVVHRIDQDSSGVVIFAKDIGARNALQAQFKRREPERLYHAVVYGGVQPDAGTWRDHLVWDTKALIQKPTHARDPRGLEAVSDYRVVERFAEASLLEVRLRSGRRNQIRIQASLRGHPLVGEQRYVEGSPARKIPFRRQALHATSVGFDHPRDGRRLDVRAPFPPDFQDLLARLRRTRAGAE
jgi:23S rRNA pseudouridine1911/1915/1917 synthase